MEADVDQKGLKKVCDPERASRMPNALGRGCRGRPPQALHLCRHSDSLLFQFILSEFLTAHQAIHELPRLYDAFAGGIREERGDLGLPLLNALGELAGAMPEEAFDAPWTRRHGTLAHLKHYCLSYAAPAGHELQSIARQVFYAALNARDLLWSLQAPLDEERYALDLACLSGLVSRLVSEIDAFSEQLKSHLLRYGRDENVIYYLLQQSEPLLKIYSAEFLCNLLKEMFADGTSDARSFLQDRYHERGFDHLLPSIDELLSKISGL